MFSKQILPNNPIFTDVILESAKLIIFRQGITLVLSDDIELKILLQ